MTGTRSTIAATFAAVLIGGLMTNPASAAAKWSDISAVTHGPDAATVLPQVGGFDGIRSSDLSAVTHSSAPADKKQVGRISGKNYSQSDISAVTHN